MEAEAERFLYLTTIGRTSGLPRAIEIWFVGGEGPFYVVSGDGEGSGWVKNIAKTPAVRVRIGTRAESGDGAPAAARIVREAELGDAIAVLMRAKYGWGDGLVVEITPETLSESI